MNCENFDFYEDDEGIAVNIDLDSFNEVDVQCVYLESYTSDKKIINDINYLLKNQKVFFERSASEISSYVERVYKNKVVKFKLMKIYFFPDVENEFGFVFRWEGDTEHGIGIKFLGLSIKKIGGAEVAFL